MTSLTIFLFLIDSILSRICSVIDHRRHKNVVKASVTHLATGECTTFLLLSHFDVICDLLRNRYTETWNPFNNYMHALSNVVFICVNDIIPLLTAEAIFIHCMALTIASLFDGGVSKFQYVNCENL